jgi:hypothetical protein
MDIPIPLNKKSMQIHKESHAGFLFFITIEKGWLPLFALSRLLYGKG